jgi:hypothetical protein
MTGALNDLLERLWPRPTPGPAPIPSVGWLSFRAARPLVELGRVAGGGALTQFGRILAELLEQRAKCAEPAGEEDAEP